MNFMVRNIGNYSFKGILCSYKLSGHLKTQAFTGSNNFMSIKFFFNFMSIKFCHPVKISISFFKAELNKRLQYLFNSHLIRIIKNIFFVFPYLKFGGD